MFLAAQSSRLKFVSCSSTGISFSLPTLPRALFGWKEKSGKAYYHIHVFCGNRSRHTTHGATTRRAKLLCCAAAMFDAIASRTGGNISKNSHKLVDSSLVAERSRMSPSQKRRGVRLVDRRGRFGFRIVVRHMREFRDGDCTGLGMHLSLRYLYTFAPTRWGRHAVSL